MQEQEPVRNTTSGGEVYEEEGEQAEVAGAGNRLSNYFGAAEPTASATEF